MVSQVWLKRSAQALFTMVCQVWLQKPSQPWLINHGQSSVVSETTPIIIYHGQSTVASETIQPKSVKHIFRNHLNHDWSWCNHDKQKHFRNISKHGELCQSILRVAPNSVFMFTPQSTMYIDNYHTPSCTFLWLKLPNFFINFFLSHQLIDWFSLLSYVRHFLYFLMWDRHPLIFYKQQSRPIENLIFETSALEISTSAIGIILSSLWTSLLTRLGILVA